MSQRPFDAFEVHLVGLYQHPGDDGHYNETIDSAEEFENGDEERHECYYTVYGYRSRLAPPDQWGYERELDDGGVEAISDLSKYEDAIDLAYALADGKMVTDMVPDSLRWINTR